MKSEIQFLPVCDMRAIAGCAILDVYTETKRQLAMTIKNGFNARPWGQALNVLYSNYKTPISELERYSGVKGHMDAFSEDIPEIVDIAGGSEVECATLAAAWAAAAIQMELLIYVNDSEEVGGWLDDALGAHLFLSLEINREMVSRFVTDVSSAHLINEGTLPAGWTLQQVITSDPTLPLVMVRNTPKHNFVPDYAAASPFLDEILGASDDFLADVAFMESLGTTVPLVNEPPEMHASHSVLSKLTSASDD